MENTATPHTDRLTNLVAAGADLMEVDDDLIHAAWDEYETIAPGIDIDAFLLIVAEAADTE